jgi:hypothetical protein
VVFKYIRIYIFFLCETTTQFEEWRLLGCYAVWLLLRTDVSEELSASIIAVTRIGELGTTLAATSNRRTLRRDTKFLRKVVSYKSHTA